MEGYTLQRLINVLDVERDNIKESFLNTRVSGISTDSRTIKKGDVFFAIRGEKFDGAEFVDSAYESGAVLSVVNKDSIKEKNYTSPVVPVENTVHALGEVAKDYRTQFTGKVVAVTGTNGKTTAREMMLAVLGTRWNVHGTRENFNNHIGLPLSIFGLEKKHNCAVFEIGMSAQGEIAYLANITKPDIGVILNVGPGHIEFFTGLEEVAEAKMELLDSIGNEGVAVINGDDELLKECDKRSASKIVKFGVNGDWDYRAENIEIQHDGCARFDVDRHSIKLNVPGFHNVYNAMAAYVVGRILEVDSSEAALALGKFKAPKMRMESFMKNGIHFINDSYNANPFSMRAAADVLQNIKVESKIAILGDMLELGDISDESHLCIGEIFGYIGLEWLCFIGENAELYYRGALKGGMNSETIKKFSDIDSAIEFINKIKRTGDLIFVKGSRALGMEKIIDVISGAC